MDMKPHSDKKFYCDKCNKNTNHKYEKKLVTENCEIELPAKYSEALRCLTLSYVYEKSKRDPKERDLSIHYFKRYTNEKENLKRKKRVTENVTSNFQII